MYHALQLRHSSGLALCTLSFSENVYSCPTSCKLNSFLAISSSLIKISVVFRSIKVCSRSKNHCRVCDIFDFSYWVGGNYTKRGMMSLITFVVTALPQHLYLWVSLTPSVQPSGNPCSLSHSVGVSLLICEF